MFTKGPKPSQTPKLFDRVVLHIGQQKCGSKSIQLFIEDNEVALAEKGIVTLKCTKWGRYDLGLKAFAGDEEAARLCLEDRRQPLSTIRDFRESLREAVLSESTNLEASTLLLSFEGLFHEAKPGIRQIVGLLRELSDNLDIFSVVRRQDRYATSAYSTRLVNSGSTHPALLFHGPSQPVGLDCYHHLELWASVVGRKAMQVVAYEDYKNILDAYLNGLGLTAGEFDLPTRQNTSLSAESQEILRQFNLIYGDRPEWQNSAELIRRELQASLPKGASRLPTASEVDQHLRYYVKSNARLMKKYLPNDTRFDEPTPDLPHDNPVPPVSSEDVEHWVRRAAEKKNISWPE